MEESLIKRLMTSRKCGACGQHYEVENINVFGHHEDLWFLSTFCPTCHTQCLVAAIIRESKVTELITDLTEAELDRFRNTGGLTANDVVDMHNLLKDFDGDFSQLFSQR